MRVVETIGDMRRARGAMADVGLVPTMGFLHEGHMSLVRRAGAECETTAVSIFVNPTQFGPSEDLNLYPRDLPRDLALLEAEGVDIVFAPPPSEIYPSGFHTSVGVGAVADPLEGASRPGHFSGVATVVAKLFNIVDPSRAYFGQKDAQQCVVIRQMVRDLNFPVEVVVAPTVREADGLALSSRNVYLGPEERRAAPVIYRALSEARTRFEAGERDAAVLRALIRGVMGEEPLVDIDYVSLADPDTLRELERVGDRGLASLAARIGRTRLIDNILLESGRGRS